MCEIDATLIVQAPTDEEKEEKVELGGNHFCRICAGTESTHVQCTQRIIEGKKEICCKKAQKAIRKKKHSK